MSHKFIRDGIEEIVEREQYNWQVLYNDGSSLKQFADDETFHQFVEIDQSQPFIFQILNNSDQVVASLLFHPERMKKLIHFYKRYHLDVGGPSERKVTLHIFGFENNNGKVLNVITPNGEIVVCDDLTGLQVS